MHLSIKLDLNTIQKENLNNYLIEKHGIRKNGLKKIKNDKINNFFKFNL
jgi:DNA-binding Xre family transcriptional regulator